MKKFFESITRNLPFRMAIGKFGIVLMSLGRFLQVRYANWNSEFRLEHQFHGDTEQVTVHVSHSVTDDIIVSFPGPQAQERKQTPLVKALFSVKGVQKICLYPYEIHVTKARVFSWGELLPEIDRVVLENLAAA